MSERGLVLGVVLFVVAVLIVVAFAGDPTCTDPTWCEGAR